MRPFIHVNCAMSADGKIAGSDRKQVRISSPEDKERVKRLRKQYDSILVGVGTVLADNPHLTIKGADFDDNPIRIVIDPHGRTPQDADVVDDRARTVIVTLDSCDITWPNVSIIRCESIVLSDIMEHLAQCGIESVLVEGGGETIASFFRERIVDRYTVFVGSMLIGGRTSPTPVDGDGWIAEDGIQLEFKGSEVLGDGVLLTYIPRYE